METKGVAHKLDAKERTEDVRIKELAPFSKMLLSESVRKGLQAAGFVYPTVIQATAIPVGKSGLDLLVQSKSGTGKTLIFSTIVLEFYKSDVREPQSLIVAPTREIAVQIEEILNQIGKYCAGFRAVCVIGGMDVVEDRKRLQGAKSVVGTPGRILHLIQNEVLNTSQMSLLVLDEADKMYTHTFRQDLQRIRKALPNRRQTIACSATFVDNLDQELAKVMKNPLLISTEEKATLLVGIKQFVYELPEQKTSILEMQLKLEALRHIFGRVTFKQCLIFAGSQSRADSYCSYLEKEGWPCELISGAQDQKTRLQNFRKFREFKTRILLATDLMARGVDSEHVNLVINLELPFDVVTYLHRIGRAGRFGSHGVAISFIASNKDHKTFRKLITEVGSGMKVLKFPVKAQEESEARDLWHFGEFEEDAKHFGVYEYETHKLLAPLASQDNITLTSSLSSDNKENVTNNVASNQQSSIDTNTFLVNSKDSALKVPNLSNEQQLNVQTTSKKNDSEIEDLPRLVTPPPAPNPSENLNNTHNESHNSSSHHLLTSNTIDDASSIAADSLRSSQQDISRYQSVLMQKSAIPTLVEFLVDRHSSQDSQTKENGETCIKIDLFDAYTKEVLNNNESVTETAVTADEPILSSNKLAQLKSLLIDKPDEKSPLNEDHDLYSDFANFQEDDISSSVSQDIDKQTFILSVATPSIQEQNSFSELQNDSSDLYPATDETTISTDTHEREKEKKHFPSPAHNKTPQLPGFVSVVVAGQQQQQNSKHQQQQHKKLQQKLSINKTAQIEIPPYQSPPNSVSPIMNALQNNDNDTNAGSSSDSTSNSTPSNREEIAENSATDVERSGNTSGFDEKTTTSKSSGIESSEHNHVQNIPQPFHVYYTSSEDDSYESDDEDEEDDDEDEEDDDEEEEEEDLEEEEEEEEEESDDKSEHYFGSDKEDLSSDDDDSIEEELENATANSNMHNAANSSNTSSNTAADSMNLAYQTAYSRWIDLYWNQMTLVQDYVKFFNFTRQQQHEN